MSELVNKPIGELVNERMKNKNFLRYETQLF